MKLLLLGMGSDSDMNKFKEIRLDGLTIEEYFGNDTSQIKLFHHPNTNSHLITSVHRTPEHADGYANDMFMLAMFHQFVPVLLGGRALHLPGIMAAKMPGVPVVATPTDIDAFFSCYRMPDSTPIGVVAMNNLELAIRYSEKILTLNSLPEFNIIRSEGVSSKKYDPMISLLRTMLPNDHKINERTYDTTSQYDGVTIFIAKDNHEQFSDLDKRVQLGVFCAEDLSTMQILERKALDPLVNSVGIGTPLNAALFALRIGASVYKPLNATLIKYSEVKSNDLLAKCPAMQITIHNFS